METSGTSSGTHKSRAGSGQGTRQAELLARAATSFDVLTPALVVMAGAQTDPVTARLEKAEQDYGETAAKIRDSAEAEIDRLVGKASDQGNLEAVNRLEEMRREIAASTGLPRHIPTKGRSAARRAWTELLKEYERAKEANTKALCGKASKALASAVVEPGLDLTLKP